MDHDVKGQFGNDDDWEKFGGKSGGPSMTGASGSGCGCLTFSLIVGLVTFVVMWAGFGWDPKEAAMGAVAAGGTAIAFGCVLSTVMISLILCLLALLIWFFWFKKH